LSGNDGNRGDHFIAKTIKTWYYDKKGILMKSQKKVIIGIFAVFGLLLASCDDGNDTNPGTPLPNAPTGLVSVTKSETTITLAWGGVSGATKYHVYAGTSVGNLNLRGSPTVTSYLLDGLNPNTIYYIAVSAENKTGEGEKSAAIRVTTSFTPLPNAPTGLVSVTHTETTIALAWGVVSGATKYHIYAGTSAGNLNLRGSPTITSYLLEGLNPNTTYYIAVSAENKTGEGGKSATITVTTNLGVKPASPSGLTAGFITENSIAVSWNNVIGASGYKVFAGTTAATMSLRGSPTETSFTITELNANTTYYIAVSTQTASNESDQSTPINTITKPAAPTGLTVGTITSNSIAVTWTSISNISGYNVYVGTTSGNMTQHGTPMTNSYTITNLAFNTEYYIAVSANNVSGESNQSSAITATTKLPAPTGIIATPQLSSTSIQVSWNAIVGAATYKVYRSSSATGAYSNIGSTPGTSYNDTGLTVSTPYYYKVSAVTSNNVEGELSDYVQTSISAQTKDITSFRFDDFSVNGTINGPNISVTVPNIVNLTTLVPTIVHNGKSVSPASGVGQDFRSPIQYIVTAEDNTTMLYTVTVTVTNTTLATAFTWINNNARSGRTYTIVAQASASLAPVTISNNSDNTVNIILSGGTTEKTITLSGNGSLFTIRYGTLTLDNNITLQGHSSNNASLVRLDGTYAYPNLVMNAGSKIINNTTTVNCTSSNDANAAGGAVKVEMDCTFTMNGGTISGHTVVAINNSSSSYNNSTPRAMGGGVYIESNGKFIMNNGTISNNKVTSNVFPVAGGGVFVNSSSSSFIMTNGTISGNTLDSPAATTQPYAYGGGVAAWDGTFTMQGGTISGNTAKSSAWVTSTSHAYGGGVYVRNNKFTKTGGTINGTGSNIVTADDAVGNAAYALVGSTTLKRNATAGTSVNLDSSKTGSAGGWE
jgi:fibronectin type 3 domain-containing protein